VNGDGSTGEFSEINPFPSTGVAPVSHMAGDVATIPTPAVKQAVGELRSYLQARPRGDGEAAEQGRVLAIVGEYGTGKTHLAAHLMDVARQDGGADVQQIYLNAPADTFTSLYQSFANKLDQHRDIVTTRVRHFYARVVADDLDGLELYDVIVERLLGDELDPVDVVRNLRLAESALLDEVQQRLRRVTDNTAFGQALTLLLRPGFEDAVWKWFLGNEPDEILRERGINSATTATESSALDAMGFFALLIGHDRYRFMVVVDELDQLVSAANRPAAEVQAALKQLLAVFLSAGSFLILAGLPEFLDSLREDVRRRISREIAMTPLSTEDTLEYIRLRQGGQRLFPFTPDVVSYIVDIASGSPRRIVGLCYRLYRRAADENSLVTEAMVRGVAQELTGSNADTLHRDIRRTLTAHGLSATRDRMVGTVLVDYWIPLAGSRAAAVLVNSGVLDGGQLTGLVSDIGRLRSNADIEAFVVVGGFLSQHNVEALRNALGRDPIIFQRGFAEEFDAALRGVESRLDWLDSDDPNAAVLNRLNRLGQQQSNVLDSILGLAENTEKFRDLFERSMAGLDRRFDDAWDARPPAETSPASTSVAAAPSRLPAGVVDAFDDAFDALAIDVRLSGLLRKVFDEGAEASSARRRVTALLRDDRFQVAAGVVFVLREFTESFRRAVTEWYRSASSEDRGYLRDPHRLALEKMTNVFDNFLGFLPVYDISWIAQQLAPSEESRRGILDEGVRGGSFQVQDVLAGLSARVRTEALADFRTDS
jgi:Cdc6-like AAA superfamily ATPase